MRMLQIHLNVRDRRSNVRPPRHYWTRVSTILQQTGILLVGASCCRIPTRDRLPSPHARDTHIYYEIGTFTNAQTQLRLRISPRCSGPCHLATCQTGRARSAYVLEASEQGPSKHVCKNHPNTSLTWHLQQRTATCSIHHGLRLKRLPPPELKRIRVLSSTIIASCESVNTHIVRVSRHTQVIGISLARVNWR